MGIRRTDGAYRVAQGISDQYSLGMEDCVSWLSFARTCLTTSPATEVGSLADSRFVVRVRNILGFDASVSSFSETEQSRSDLHAVLPVQRSPCQWQRPILVKSFRTLKLVTPPGAEAARKEQNTREQRRASAHWPQSDSTSCSAWPTMTNALSVPCIARGLPHTSGSTFYLLWVDLGSCSS